LQEGKIKAALIIGEDPLENPSDERYFRGMEFVAVLDLFPTETTRIADIVLPASSYIETGGSYTRADRKVSRFGEAYSSPTGRININVLSDLAYLLGKPFNFRSIEDVQDEIKLSNPYYKDCNFEDSSGKVYYWGSDCCNGSESTFNCCKFATPNGKACFSTYQVSTGTYKAEEYTYNSIDSRYNDMVRKLFLKGKLMPVLA
jgi:predicted molibdopterin-dependent oxidoreductase YjgC